MTMRSQISIQWKYPLWGFAISWNRCVERWKYF